MNTTINHTRARAIVKTGVRGLIDDAKAINVPFDPPDPDLTSAHYPKTCAMLGVVRVSRERALGLMQEWNEVLAGRPDPTTH